MRSGLSAQAQPINAPPRPPTPSSGDGISPRITCHAMGSLRFHKPRMAGEVGPLREGAGGQRTVAAARASSPAGRGSGGCTLRERTPSDSEAKGVAAWTGRRVRDPHAAVRLVGHPAQRSQARCAAGQSMVSGRLRFIRRSL